MAKIAGPHESTSSRGVPDLAHGHRCLLRHAAAVIAAVAVIARSVLFFMPSDAKKNDDAIVGQRPPRGRQAEGEIETADRRSA